jgi:HSP20 family molecular chaperone IbpA
MKCWTILIVLYVSIVLCQIQHPAPFPVSLPTETKGTQGQTKTTIMDEGILRGTRSPPPSQTHTHTGTHFGEQIVEMEKKVVDLWKKRWNLFEKVIKRPSFWPFKAKEDNHDLATTDLFDDFDAFAKSMDWEPRAQLIEGHDKLKIKVELPGVQKSDLTIELKTTPDNQRDILRIRGVKKSDTLKTNEKHYIHEISFGEFGREWVFAKSRIIGAPVATLRDGILTIELVKKDIEEIKPRIIPIQIVDSPVGVLPK